MTRFPDAVLKQAWLARIERETEVRDRLGIDPATESAEADTEGLAAMRAVLENHLKTYVCAWCEHFIDDHDAHGCKVRGCVCMPITEGNK